MASDKTIVVNGDLAAVIRCQRCGGNVYEAEKMVTSIGCYHPGCFKCAKCSRSLDQSSCNVGQDEKGGFQLLDLTITELKSHMNC